MRGCHPIVRSLAILGAVAFAQAAFAQPAYTPARTAWGDPDFRGTWPIDRIFQARIPLERPQAFGDRQLLTDEEFAVRLEEARKSDAGYANDLAAQGSEGLAEWLRSTPFGRRSSLLVSPANGRLPPLTAQGEALEKAGRSSWSDNPVVDWVTDLDAFDRCLSRGLPTVMLPFPAANGVRIFQSPGFVVLQLEALGARIIPLGSDERWPSVVRGWMGQSRGRWEGNTLVIETSNIVAGDSVSTDPLKRAATPLPGDARRTVPVSEKASVVERLTMTGPDTIAYEMTYSDPDVFAAPWTVQLERTRDSGYRLYEYACHESNQIRYMITGSRAQRRDGVASAARRPEDGTGRWPFPGEPPAE